MAVSLAQSREGITSRTAALEWPQERGRAAAWANVRARSGYVSIVAGGPANVPSRNRRYKHRKSDIAEATDGSDSQSHERLANPSTDEGMG